MMNVATRVWRSMGGLAVLAVVGCGGKAAPTSEGVTGTIQADGPGAAVDGAERVSLDGDRYLGDPVVADNLTVWPVYGEEVAEIGEFLTIEEAQAQGLAQLSEHGAEDGSDSATVGSLTIGNDGDLPVVVIAGTVVKGGQQDRQIAQDLVVPPRSRIAVEAFCIEEGRWTVMREGEDSEGIFAAQACLAAKNIRVSGQYGGDQSAVWENVAAVNGRTGKAPSTGTYLATVEDGDADALLVREKMRMAVRDALAPRGIDAEGNTLLGFAYSVNGEPLGGRSFASGALFERFFPSFLNTMCVEAQVARHRDEARGREVYQGTAPVEAVALMIRNIARAESRRTETAGLNDNVIRSNHWGGNSACMISVANRQVPLTEDWTTAAVRPESVNTQLSALRALGYLGD